MPGGPAPSKTGNQNPDCRVESIDLPLAARTIMSGVDQTILMSLAMVVVASLIGAKGLGEDILEALQAASESRRIKAICDG